MNSLAQRRVGQRVSMSAFLLWVLFTVFSRAMSTLAFAMSVMRVSCTSPYDKCPSFKVTKPLASSALGGGLGAAPRATRATHSAGSSRSS
eukprot:600633-Prorocentrum_minimum.AAC.1